MTYPVFCQNRIPVISGRDAWRLFSYHYLIMHPKNQVDHGADIPILVRALVEPPTVELVTTSLDFGLVRLSDTATLPLVFRNTSKTAMAEWSLSEQLPPRSNEEDDSPRTRIEFNPRASGTLAPGEQV